jgi:ribose transport system substrate-binding protein
LNAAIRKIERAGIPLISFVSRLDGVKPQTFISSDNYRLAFSVAGRLIDVMGGRGDVVVMEGSPDSSTSLPRTKGFLEAVAAHPGVRVVGQRSGYYQRSAAMHAMVDILKQTPNIDGVLCANDFMAMGVLDALDAAQRHAFVVGVNAMPDAIRAIKAGRMQATAAYDAMKMGCIAVEAAIRFLKGQSVADYIELPAEIVDASNCAAWDQLYEERPLPVWEHIVGSGR